jgi:hypothetical protein
VKTLQRPEPFFGEAVDREILGPEFKSAVFDEMAEPDVDLVLEQAYAGSDEIFDAAFCGVNQIVGPRSGEGNPAGSVHPDYCEKGTELALGFIPHRGENRRQRRAAVANFEHPEADRRELWLQRQRQRRGKLDPELRRLQRRKAATK